MKPLPEQSISSLLDWLGVRDEFVFLDCAKVDNENYRSYLFSNPVRWLACTEPEQAVAFLAEVDRLRQEGFYLAGWLCYEFGYLLEPSLLPLCPSTETPYAILGVFEEPFIIDHRTENPDHPGLKTRTEREGMEETVAIEDCRPSITNEEYLQAVDRIKEYIIDGDTYQVNYTLKLQFRFKGEPGRLYRLLRRNQSVSYGAWIRQGGRDIMSFSPELFFRSNGERITVRPMKGTIDRGRFLADDERQRNLLRSDLKNRSENVMIVDLLRNDLARLLRGAKGGRVKPRRLFEVEVYDTLLQMTSTIDAIPAGRSWPGFRDTVQALFPCGSVTGAPKIRTMEIIRELEREPRGVYCGAIGFSGPRDSVFNVPIRTVQLAGSRGEMGIGSGIVHDSDPEAEWRESLLKAYFLTRPRRDFQLIETLLWQPGTGYWLLDQHMDRLTDSATYFLIPHKKEDIVALLEQEARAFTGGRRVRLLLQRDGSMNVTSTELDRNFQPVLVPQAEQSPLPKATFSEYATSSDAIHLYHKTTDRQLYMDERKRAQAKGYYEVLFINGKGEVTEGSISNIFIAGSDRLLTPPVRCGLLAGTFRRWLIDHGRAVEQVLQREDVLAAEAVYVGNSVRGLVQVKVEEGERLSIRGAESESYSVSRGSGMAGSSI